MAVAGHADRLSAGGSARIGAQPTIVKVAQTIQYSNGLNVSKDGNYDIAQNGSGRVLVVTDEKRLVRTIDVATPYVTNMSFGPAGAVYITGPFEQWKPPFLGAVYRWTP